MWRDEPLATGSPKIWPPDAEAVFFFVALGACLNEEACAAMSNHNLEIPNSEAHRKFMIRAALYARVSTANNGQDPSLQTRELREYCERRGWQLAGEYVDVGISGAKEKRPELDRLMADAYKRRFDVVIVWKFDRFARSVSHLLRALETFKAPGIEFVSFSEQLDTSTPAGKLVFTVLGAVAELERSLIIERVRAGMRNAKAKGKRI